MEEKIITHELLKSWGPCQSGYRRFCELFPDGADLKAAIDGLVKDDHDDWGFWLFTECRNRKLFADVTALGYGNSGDWNSGNRNSGDWNSGDWNSGFFNVDTPEDIFAFGKACKRSIWENAYKPSFLFFDLTYWVDESQMTDKEKKADPMFYIRGGQLRKREYKEAWKYSWDNADPEDQIKVNNLPNFDAEICFQMSGIDLR